MDNVIKENLEPGLYLVPTPIGNLRDITLRAMDVLSSANLVLCEDTRHSRKLFDSMNLHPRSLSSYHDHNETEKADWVANFVSEGNSVALISDAGSPCISDPGYRVVNAVRAKGLKVIPLPGATACVPALTASGFAVHEFTFVGFPPQKKGRQTFMKEIAERKDTVIMYESPNRIEKLMAELDAVIGTTRRVCVARELTKIHEEITVGTAAELYKKFAGRNVKGEITIVIENLVTD